jgi:hypothetical protein
MSWYGKHPVIAKEQAKQLIPPGACKHTIYWIRCLPSISMKYLSSEEYCCSRCGITFIDQQIKQECVRRGWIPGSEEFRYFP